MNPSVFPDVSTSLAGLRRGASQGIGKGGWAHQKRRDFVIRHGFIFGRLQLVIQLVIPSNFFIEAPMEQQQLALLGRLHAPSVVPPHLIATCKTYRDAVRLCWHLRRVRNMTQRNLAQEAGLYAPHVTCYLHDSKRQRDLPGEKVRDFEWTCGNTAISQWHNVNAKLTVVEEMTLLRAAA